MHSKRHQGMHMSTEEKESIELAQYKQQHQEKAS
jgi:predicted DNA-binding protein (UPF0251 family)